MKVYSHDPNCILVVNDAGKLRKLYTPFRVVCIESTGSISINTQVYVEAVVATERRELFYIIFQQPHPHHCFIVLMFF